VVSAQGEQDEVDEVGESGGQGWADRPKWCHFGAQWRNFGQIGWPPGVDVSYAALEVHRIVNVALHQEYSPGIVFIFSQGRKDLNHV
jgi:hypothetical protein